MQHKSTIKCALVGILKIRFGLYSKLFSGGIHIAQEGLSGAVTQQETIRRTV